MLKIFIQGLKDGEYDVELTSKAGDIPEMFEEFIGDVTVTGKLKILGKRFTFIGVAECQAKMECDLTLKEFTETITAEIKMAIIADNTLLSLSRQNDYQDERVIHEDDKYIDISSDVREELALNLPMKRIFPEYRGKSFEEIFPEFGKKPASTGKKKKNAVADDRWNVLKNLKLN
jgi:uncharacterized metal-binding protein YceD (DUF177 family)